MNPSVDIHNVFYTLSQTSFKIVVYLFMVNWYIFHPDLDAESYQGHEKRRRGLLLSSTRT